MARKIGIIVLKVLYFVFVFAIGWILAVSIPKTLFYDSCVGTVNKSLLAGDYKTAASITNVWADYVNVYEETFADDAKLVMMPAVCTDADENDNQYFYECYVGYLFNVKSKYNVTLNDEQNATKIVIYSSTDEKVEIEIIDYDDESDTDSINETVSSLVKYNFIYFEVKPTEITDINKIEFKDCTGQIYQTSTNVNLNFNESFFTDVQPYVNEVNTNGSTSALTDYASQLAAHDNYVFTNTGGLYKNANIKATVYILIYFVIVYIIADFLVGKRWILHGIQKLIGKIKGKNQKINDSNDPAVVDLNKVYGTDYYCQLTYKINLDTYDGNQTIVIRYSNDNTKENLEFILSKDKNYELTQRVHAGLYMNAWIDCPGYRATNLPSMIEVRGFKMEVEVSLEKVSN